MIQVASDTDTKILTKHQVAKLLQVNERTIDDWAKNRGLPRLKLGGATIRFDRDVVLKWALAQTEGGSSE